MSLDSIAALRLPQPRRVRATDGACSLGSSCELDDQVADRRLAKAWQRLAAAHPDSLPALVRLTAGGREADTCTAQGYALTVQPDVVELDAGSAAGVFYGLQTLDGLLDTAGRDEEAASALPCGCIEDEPDFAIRGVLYDVTRGKVPTLETLEHVVDHLAALKVNQLQLNIEHAFVFSFDPEICSPWEGITPDEVRALEEFARDRFITLVPALATLGHMGHVLSMPKYRHLAEIEADRPWGEMDWRQRMHGLTLDVLNPESLQLVEWMWSDVLDAFSSPVVNICGDEPWDLGRGRNRDRLPTDVERGRAYADRIVRTSEIVASKGRRAQFWSDFIKNHPAELKRLPADIAVLHWGYDDAADYERTSELVDAGAPVLVCPGTNGWKRLLPPLDAAERNITTFARAGKNAGAAGLLMTDWGDHGHVNTLAASWHGLALGACCGWRADHPSGATFDEAFTRWLFGKSSPQLMRSWREASFVGEACETWPVLWLPAAQVNDHARKFVAARQHVPAFAELFAGTLDEDDLPSAPVLAASEDALQTLRKKLPWTNADAEELDIAAGLHHVFIERLWWLRDRADGGRGWKEALEALLPRASAIWMRHHKPAGWKEIETVLRARMEENSD